MHVLFPHLEILETLIPKTVCGAREFSSNDVYSIRIKVLSVNTDVSDRLILIKKKKKDPSSTSLPFAEDPQFSPSLILFCML